VEELEADSGIHEILGEVQEKTAFLPDYGLKASVSEREINPVQDEAETWPAVSAGTSLSGLIGGVMTLILTGLIGIGIGIVKRRRKIGTA
jgi:cobalt/nickel transport system permease protein